jgi:hypothetical protein
MNRLREVFAWLLTILAAGLIIAVLTLLNGKSGARERLIVGAAMLTLLTISGAESFFATRKIRASRKRLRGLTPQSASWSTAAPSRTRSQDSSTWLDDVSRRANDLADASRGPDGDFDLDELPLAADLVQPVRAEAEKLALILRWFSQTAVLVGLVGTLYGLGLAINGAVSALNGTQVRLDDLKKALEPLTLCFTSSGFGVITSLALGLLRLVYEVDLDFHFAELEAWLACKLRGEFFASWSPPSHRIASTIGELSKVTTSLEQLSRHINDNTNKLLKTSLDAIEQKVGPIPEKLSAALEKGLREGTRHVAEMVETSTALVLKHTSDAAHEVAVKLAELTTEAAKPLREVQEALESSVSDYRKEMTEVAKQFRKSSTEMASAAPGVLEAAKTMRGATAGLSKTLDELVAKADAISQRLDNRVDGLTSRMGRAEDGLGEGLARMAGSVEAAATEINAISKACATSTSGMTAAIKEAVPELRGAMHDASEVYAKAQLALTAAVKQLDLLRVGIEKQGAALDRVVQFDQEELVAHRSILEQVGLAMKTLGGTPA